ncbi:tetratricopeptide repeat protein 1 [Syngnathoides biaculeatus]|uniref:tetratricopeptide repeat protein 1 n=1 Tax=Syngnathoides biaculeatus TaxID=300417 RepID=UPI002ADE6DB9|nr:tetratricopeptide repeat protein 1 [Syngnathoides biaculeatus]XP_061658436.1 tetratricopeptide repeat protein 1 [Syngnathoides biaculeatus]XP_061658437.1 tetratricopeptide repeat protein 1 [Syngnathoides biaculeatus]
MSGPADDQRRSEEDAVDREDFFDCQETLELRDRGDEDGRRMKTDAEPEPADDAQANPLGDTLDDSDGEAENDDQPKEEEEEKLSQEEKESRRLRSLTLKDEGNCHFKSGDWSTAEQSYTQALRLCPRSFGQERAVLFSNRAAARLHMERKDDGIADCSRALELNPDYVKALLRRAELYEQTEQLEKALDDYQKVLERDPTQAGARQACARLPQQIHEKNEKLKEEMLGKLKELGNMVLRPFGLSTNNFQVNQDADTGSYSINFVNKTNNNT